MCRWHNNTTQLLACMECSGLPRGLQGGLSNAKSGPVLSHLKSFHESHCLVKIKPIIIMRIAVAAELTISQVPDLVRGVCLS